MTLKVRFKCDAKCSAHTTYDPESGDLPRRDCPGCDALYSIWLYTKIAANKASNTTGADFDFHGKKYNMSKAKPTKEKKANE